MIPIENVLLEVVRCIDVGRASLANRGVETPENIKLDELVEKIADIPIYSFNGNLKSSTSLTMIPHKDDVKVVANIQPAVLTANTNITIEE